MDGNQYQSGPASLFAVIARANVPSEQCCCFELAGDNPDCPIHNAHWVGNGKDRRQEIHDTDKRADEQDEEEGVNDE